MKTKFFESCDFEYNEESIKKNADFITDTLFIKWNDEELYNLVNNNPSYRYNIDYQSGEVSINRNDGFCLYADDFGYMIFDCDNNMVLKVNKFDDCNNREDMDTIDKIIKELINK